MRKYLSLILGRSVVTKKQFRMSQKYFINPYSDYNGSEGSATEIWCNSKMCKCINDRWNATEEKLKKLEFRDYSVYTGSSGYALLRLKKEPNNPKNLKEIKKLLCLDNLKRRRHTFLCGDAGPLAIGIVVNDKLGKHEEVEHLLTKLRAMNKDILNVQSDIPSEYLYGRAGYLYAIMYVNENVSPPPFEDSFISELCEAIILCGRNVSKAGRFKCPLMYQWHDSYYLGAAHGLSGILYLLLKAKQYIKESELNAFIRPTIDYLLSQRFPTGNFPSSIGKDADKYVQWCHGAPGFVHLLTTAYKEEKHLYRASKFAEWCLHYKKQFEEVSPDRPLSLFEGIAGPMYLLLDMHDPMEAMFPGFALKN